MTYLLKLVVIVLATLVSSSVAAEDAWPTGPIKVVVPSSPGGGTDEFARLLAQALSDSLKQSFVIENRPGASGNIGTEVVAHAVPNGYTLLVSANAALAINPAMQTNVPFDVARDLAPVSRGVMAINVLVVNPSLGVKSVKDFIAAAKNKPGELAFGSAGTATSPYLGVRKIEDVTGTTYLHVPYKGMGPAYADLLGGRLQFMYTDVASVLPHIKAGMALPLAVDHETSLLPGVGTFAEAGLQFDAPTSFSVMAPAGTPPPILR